MNTKEKLQAAVEQLESMQFVYKRMEEMIGTNTPQEVLAIGVYHLIGEEVGEVLDILK